MKPAEFAYFAPRTLEEAIFLLDEHGYEAKLLAGGQSLVPLMNLRLARPAVLVDLNRVDELAFVKSDNRGHDATPHGGDFASDHEWSAPA